jgi:hypothetical protein
MCFGSVYTREGSLRGSPILRSGGPILDRLRRQITVTGDSVLAELLQELSAFPIASNLRATQAAIPPNNSVSSCR